MTSLTPTSHGDVTAPDGAQELSQMPSLLVIEDDPLVRDTLVRTLRPQYDVHEASSVAAALTALRQSTPDVVVLDLCLDREASSLHDALSRREIPVVLVSGRDPEQLPSVAEARGWPYLAKPVAPATLRTTPAQAQAAAQAAPTMQASAAMAVPPPPATGNIVADSVNSLVHGAQTATYEATGKKFSPMQMGMILTAVGLLIGFGIYFVGVFMDRKR